MAVDINTILGWFKAGEKPTQTQYAEAWQSFWNKLEDIPAASIADLTNILDNKVGINEVLYTIDSAVIAGIYSITVNDWEKTLVYTGAGNITILLSTAIVYRSGSGLKIMQRGTGKITFGVDGFLLNHAPDEMPVLYAQHCTAAILVTATTVPEVLIYGKLQLT